MARRAFLHLGTPKSGTTYLQGLWWGQRTALRGQGLLLPGRDEHVQFQASAIVRGNEPVLATMDAHQRGAWDRLLQESADWDGDVLFSQEQLVETPADRAAAAVGAMDRIADEVHLVLTARDLARTIPSAWQQRVKHGSDTTLQRFCERVAKDDPDFNFWRHQDLPRILDRWADGLPAGRVHLVPLPRPGGPRDLLWTRMCDLLGLDATTLSAAAPVANESLTPEEVELLRRVNGEFSQAHHDVPLSRHIRRVLGPHLGSSRPRPLMLSPEMHAWAVERGDRMVDELRTRGHHVLGDLEDLRPAPERPDGTDPDAVGDDRVLAVAVPVLAALVREAGPAPAPRQTEATPTAVGAPVPATSARRWRRLVGRPLRRWAGARPPAPSPQDQRGTSAQ